MKSYLFVESEGAFASAEAPRFFALARTLARQGAKVEIMLTQNGVTAARAGARADGIRAALDAGIPVVADAFSMKERALRAEELTRGISPVSIRTVVERMAQGWNVVWN